MIGALLRSILATGIFTVLLCGVYPFFIYGVGSLLFSGQAAGGILLKNGKPVGARLIGQKFTQPQYFHGRPSFAGNDGYDAVHSGGSNLGPTSQKLADTVRINIENFLKENPSVKKGEVPTELVAASGSGLDPHISPEAARVQLERVARVRKVNVEEVGSLLQSHVEGPQWGFFGEPVVNVLVLNLDLDEKYPLK